MNISYTDTIHTAHLSPNTFTEVFRACHAPRVWLYIPEHWEATSAAQAGRMRQNYSKLLQFGEFSLKNIEK
jgi:hypothetical protein